MSIYHEMLGRVANGERFHIDFEKRTMKVGKEVVINNGEYDASKSLYGYDIYGPATLLQTIEELYGVYKYSLPSERSDGKRKKYFKALPVDELTDEELAVGMPREVAQYALEALILCTIVRGEFLWDENLHGKWFWQSKSDPDLIILRNWVDGK